MLKLMSAVLGSFVLNLSVIGAEFQGVWFSPNVRSNSLPKIIPPRSLSCDITRSFRERAIQVQINDGNEWFKKRWNSEDPTIIFSINPGNDEVQEKTQNVLYKTCLCEIEHRKVYFINAMGVFQGKEEISLIVWGNHIEIESLISRIMEMYQQDSMIYIHGGQAVLLESHSKVQRTFSSFKVSAQKPNSVSYTEITERGGARKYLELFYSEDNQESDQENDMYNGIFDEMPQLVGDF